MPSTIPHFRIVVPLVLFLVAAAPAARPAPAPSGEPSIQAADQVFYQHDIAGAAEIYRAVDADAGAEAGVRADAALRYAMIEWRFYERPEAARAALDGAMARGAKVADLLAGRADLEIAGRRFAPAREAALRSLLMSRTPAERTAARLRWAKAVAGDPASDRSQLADAVSVLRRLVADDPGALEPSRFLLRAALRAGNGPAALEGWRSYYRVPPAGKPYPLLEGAYGELEAILPGWQGTADAATTVRLVRAMGASRFFEEAALVARLPGVTPEARARVSELLAYADFIKAVGGLADSYYRRTAVGKTSPDDLDRPLLGLILASWENMSLPGKPPVPDTEGLDPNRVEQILAQIQPAVTHALAARYGTYVNVGETAGYHDLHMGHTVLDEKRTVEQYGHEAEVHLVLLDEMVSNGFESWAWAYRSQHGGWATPDAIYQVRPAYADAPIKGWKRLTDPDARRDWDEEIARDAAGDDARAEADPDAYLPGLKGRLEREAEQSLRDRLAARGLSDGPLRTAFLRELEGAAQESSVFVHEGRHVIDKLLGIEDPAELEYRAKLSEIAFAKQPRAALAASIVAPNIGDKTPHGRANLRVMRGLVGWMDAHRSEIAGLDAARPLLPQLDLLTDDQLRGAARSLDPLAGH